jgi:hypothetical protein
MTTLLALNFFILLIMAIKVERAAYRQFEMDNDDVDYNDWNFETE